MKVKIMSIILGILLISLVSALTIQNVDIEPTEIAPGEKVAVSLDIENNLGEDAEDVTISLDLTDVPFAPYLSSNEESFDDIKDDKNKEVNFKLIAESGAESGVYKIPVKISYTLDGEEKSKQGTISLIINAQPNISVVGESVLIKGENKELIIKVINSGLGEAKLLSLKLKNTIGLEVIGSNSAYIGDIDSDDFDTAEFKVRINENAPSSISLPVEINYRDSRNKEVTEIKNLVLRVYTEKQAVSLGLIKKSRTISVIIGIVVLIILFFVYRKIKKALNKKIREG